MAQTNAYVPFQPLLTRSLALIAPHTACSLGLGSTTSRLPFHLEILREKRNQFGLQTSSSTIPITALCSNRRHGYVKLLKQPIVCEWEDGHLERDVRSSRAQALRILVMRLELAT